MITLGSKALAADWHRGLLGVSGLETPSRAPSLLPPHTPAHWLRGWGGGGGTALGCWTPGSAGHLPSPPPALPVLGHGLLVENCGLRLPCPTQEPPATLQDGTGIPVAAESP